MTRPQLEALALQSADTLGLPRNVMLAVIEVESGWNPWACRYEPGYQYLWNVAKVAPFRILTVGERSSVRAPDDFPALHGVSRDTEWSLQRSSLGLMQLMGANARQHGFTGPFLSALYDPATGLQYGAMHLAGCFRRYPGDIPSAIAAWNAGSARKGDDGKFVNQDYVDKVLNQMATQVA